ncbi:unnamed protein product [Mucor fragilis]
MKVFWEYMLSAIIYITSLISTGFYVMLEICSILLPKDLTQLRPFLSVVEDLLPVKSVYKNVCKRTADIDKLKSRTRPGLGDEAIMDLTSMSKNRKRPCPFVNQ